MSEHHEAISVWFFIGVLLVIFGALILGNGLYELKVPSQPPVVLAELHAPIWWGALLLTAGLFYSIKFKPGR